MEPPGAMIAVQPPSTAASRPSEMETIRRSHTHAPVTRGADSGDTEPRYAIRLAGADAARRSILGDHDAVGFDVAHDVPGQRDIVPLLRFGLSLADDPPTLRAVLPDRYLRPTRRSTRCERAARRPARAEGRIGKRMMRRFFFFVNSSSASSSNSGAATISRKNFESDFGRREIDRARRQRRCHRRPKPNQPPTLRAIARSTRRPLRDPARNRMLDDDART